MQGLRTGWQRQGAFQANAPCLQRRKLVLHVCLQPSKARAPVERRAWCWNATQAPGSSTCRLDNHIIKVCTCRHVPMPLVHHAFASLSTAMSPVTRQFGCSKSVTLQPHLAMLQLALPALCQASHEQPRGSAFSRLPPPAAGGRPGAPAGKLRVLAFGTGAPEEHLRSGPPLVPALMHIQCCP